MIDDLFDELEDMASSDEEKAEASSHQDIESSQNKSEHLTLLVNESDKSELDKSENVIEDPDIDLSLSHWDATKGQVEEDKTVLEDPQKKVPVVSDKTYVVAKEEKVQSNNDESKEEKVQTNIVVEEDKVQSDAVSKEEKAQSNDVVSKEEKVQIEIPQPQEVVAENILLDNSLDSALDSKEDLKVELFEDEKNLEAKSLEPQDMEQKDLRQPEFEQSQFEDKKDLSFVSSNLSISARDVLKRADQLKIAQDRIEELENIVFMVRQENEQLLSQVETLKQRIQDLSAHLETSERRHRTKLESLSDERTLLEESLSRKKQEQGVLQLKIEELERRLAKDLKSVRVREKELENRLELLKQEKTALLKNKDEMILNLKRKIDHLMMDIDGYRKRNQSVQIQVSENEERVQRSVRALRLALGMLEGSDTTSDKISHG